MTVPATLLGRGYCRLAVNEPFEKVCLAKLEAHHQRRPNRSPTVAVNAPSAISQSWLTKKLEVTYQIVKEQS